MDKIKPQNGQPAKNEVLLKDNGEWLHFREPYRLIEAKRPEEVLPALRELEQLTQINNWYAAGFLSYEAAAAFDPALQTRASARANPFPYLWFGLYPHPHTVSLPKPGDPTQELNWLPTIDEASYHAAVEKIKQHIAEGRTYQVNYTMRLQTFLRAAPGISSFALPRARITMRLILTPGGM
jgi:para-aminobenzoate synthetase / 4-amino-4-deoxychorismate lyase